MFLLAPRLPRRLGIACQDIGLEKKAVLVFFTPQRFDTAKTHSRPWQCTPRSMQPSWLQEVSGGRNGSTVSGGTGNPRSPFSATNKNDP
jgi:hypothetical protein